MVKMLAEVNFPTVRVVVGLINLADLPQRLCTSADIDAAMPSDLPNSQRTTVLAISTLYRNRDLSFLYLPLAEVGAALLKYAIIIDSNLARKRPEL